MHTTDFVVLACFVKTSQIKQRSSACKEEFKDLLKAVTAANTISPPQDSASPSPMRGSCTEAAATKPRQNKMAFKRFLNRQFSSPKCRLGWRFGLSARPFANTSNRLNVYHRRWHLYQYPRWRQFSCVDRECRRCDDEF